MWTSVQMAVIHVICLPQLAKTHQELTNACVKTGTKTVMVKNAQVSGIFKEVNTISPYSHCIQTVESPWEG